MSKLPIVPELFRFRLPLCTEIAPLAPFRRPERVAEPPVTLRLPFRFVFPRTVSDPPLTERELPLKIARAPMVSVPDA